MRKAIIIFYFLQDHFEITFLKIFKKKKVLPGEIEGALDSSFQPSVVDPALETIIENAKFTHLISGAF